MSARRDLPLVLVTGASGRLGTSVAGRIGKRYRLVGLDVEAPHHELEIEHRPCDLTHADSIQAELAARSSTRSIRTRS